MEALQAAGWEVQQDDKPHTLLDNFFYISGGIPRDTAFETGQPGHVRCTALPPTKKKVLQGLIGSAHLPPPDAFSVRSNSLRQDIS